MNQCVLLLKQNRWMEILSNILSLENTWCNSQQCFELLLMKCTTSQNQSKPVPTTQNQSTLKANTQNYPQNQLKTPKTMQHQPETPKASQNQSNPPTNSWNFSSRFFITNISMWIYISLLSIKRLRQEKKQKTWTTLATFSKNKQTNKQTKKNKQQNHQSFHSLYIKLPIQDWCQ